MADTTSVPASRSVLHPSSRREVLAECVVVGHIERPAQVTLGRVAWATTVLSRKAGVECR